MDDLEMASEQHECPGGEPQSPAGSALRGRTCAPVIAPPFKTCRQVPLRLAGSSRSFESKSNCVPERTVKTQVWRATGLLIAIVKERRKLKSSLYTCPQIFSVSFARKAAVARALPADGQQK